MCCEQLVFLQPTQTVAIGASRTYRRWLDSLLDILLIASYLIGLVGISSPAALVASRLAFNDSRGCSPPLTTNSFSFLVATSVAYTSSRTSSGSV